METRQSRIRKFLLFLNNQHPNIYFVDIEENGKFLFLNILVSKKDDNILGHQVYRKSTHRYIHAESIQHKQSAINLLI